jgi:hypothetical protein
MLILNFSLYLHPQSISVTLCLSEIRWRDSSSASSPRRRRLERRNIDGEIAQLVRA